MKIYTRGGDAGETGLVGGSRVGKDDPRVAACGEVDELSALLGLCLAQSPDPELASLVTGIQRDLFAIGAQLADPRGQVATERAKAALARGRIAELEAAIDQAEAGLPPLQTFILPGGTCAGAQLHLARTVCRRAERSVVALARSADLAPEVVPYLNRLSDLLFVLARQVNRRASQTEEPW
jgi:cob(I)alamin adenosyltransferase